LADNSQLVVAAASIFIVAALDLSMDLVASGEMGCNPKKSFA